jgi:hypothetical protein
MFSLAEIREINKDHAHLLGLGKCRMPYNILDISFKNLPVRKAAISYQMGGQYGKGPTPYILNPRPLR